MSTTLYAAPDSGQRDCPIHEGQMVLTVDNSRLGTVKEVTDTHFKVDVRFRRDYWLSREYVAFVDERAVGLSFRSDETELYKEHRRNDVFEPDYVEAPNENLTRWENGPFPP